jgi:transcriptional regulator with XRE-family HTH domain
MSERMPTHTEPKAATDTPELKLEKAKAFDELASALPGMAEEIRPRRWISRIGRLLRMARDHTDLGQAEISARAHVTQPYLSRLENGLLPKRGPTVEVLLRCIEAADCAIEISVRSKKDGKVIGRLDSTDLGNAHWSPEQSALSEDHHFPHMILATRRPGHGHLHHEDKVDVVFDPRHRKNRIGTVWVSTVDALGRHSRISGQTESLFTRAIENLFHGIKGRDAPVVKAIDPSNAASTTVNIQEGDLLVVGSESELTRALGQVETSEEDHDAG